MNEISSHQWWNKLPNPLSGAASPEATPAVPWYERLDELPSQPPQTPAGAIDDLKTNWWEQPQPALTEPHIDATSTSPEAANPITPDETVLRRLSHGQLEALKLGRAAVYRNDIQFLPDWPQRSAGLGSIVAVHPYLLINNGSESKA